MAILSISMDEGSLADMGRLMKTTGVKSRSRLIRMALACLLNEYRQIGKMEGKQTVVFMVTHSRERKVDMDKVAHRFGHIIRTNMHHHSERGCLDILIAEGKADELREMFGVVKNLNGVGSAFCSVI